MPTTGNRSAVETNEDWLEFRSTISVGRVLVVVSSVGLVLVVVPSVGGVLLTISSV